MKSEKKRGRWLAWVFAAGLALLLYPLVGQWWNGRTQSRAVVAYQQGLAEWDEAACAAALAAAEAYNARLAALDFPLGEGVGWPEYSCLQTAGGTMGVVTIPKIGVELPLYPGTDEAVLREGAGHLEGSSLPVGGPGTHAVIVAHRGLPSARLFTDLDQLEAGDEFTVTVLNRELCYRVEEILVVEPEDTAALALVPGEDRCTLLTCTPYGVNTHRLLVRGLRTPTRELRGLLAGELVRLAQSGGVALSGPALWWLAAEPAV